MKKLLAVALSVTMGLSLMACSNNSSSKSSTGAEKASSTASTVKSKTSSTAENGTELKGDIEYWSSWSETEAQALA